MRTQKSGEKMERIPGIMMNLIANEVCKKPLDLGQFPLSEEEQEQLYKLSKSHDLAHLVGDALMQNGLTVSPGVKEKFEKQWDEDYKTESLTGKKGDKKKIRTALNRKLRHSRKQDIADGGAYKKETSWEE